MEWLRAICQADNSRTIPKRLHKVILYIHTY